MQLLGFRRAEAGAAAEAVMGRAEREGREGTEGSAHSHHSPGEAPGFQRDTLQPCP